MPFYTPLRYPGGKRRLIPVVSRLLEANCLRDIEYAEPYAGGASVALSLLFEEFASTIHINDLNRAVYAFWYVVLNESEWLCRRIDRCKVTMNEWRRQHEVYERRDTAELNELGFATLFLNRTNRSGILGAGVIGGKHQQGIWTLGVRFKKADLIVRIRKIARYANRINLYQQDALAFTNDVVAHLGRNSFTFYDPPYLENGRQLYLDNYEIADHRRLARRIERLRSPWIVTYDYAANEAELYLDRRRLAYRMHYTSQDRYEGREVMFFSNDLEIPRITELLTPAMRAIRPQCRLRRAA